MKSQFSSRQRKTLLIIFIFLVVAMVGSMVATMLHYSKPSPDTAVTVLERSFYVIRSADGNDSLYAYVTSRGDTLITLPTDSVFLRRITRIRKASWVNDHWWASCLGRIACVEDSIDRRDHASNPLCADSVDAIIQKVCQRNEALIKLLGRQYKDLQYFLRVHDVNDDGFDIVGRRMESVTLMSDSLDSLQSLCQRCLGQGVMERRYWAVAVKSDMVTAENLDSFLHQRPVPLKPIESLREGYRMWQTTNAVTPEWARAVYLHGRMPGSGGTIGWGALRSDTLSIFYHDEYRGEVDSIGRPSGSGLLIHTDGTAYEGQWLHGERHGFGVDFGAKVRCGSWTEDRYLGESMVYHSDRVYGIDISRYQHEQGRKRYVINWSNLRITSLGKISRKRVSGAVNYPISFVYIKSTEGKSVLNKYYTTDYKQSRAHGYRTGTYHFFSTTSSASEQATHFLRNSHYNKGDMPPVLDVEPSPSQIRAMGGTEALMTAMRRWLTKVETSWGVRPVIYVSQTFVTRYLAEDLKENYPVWIARYGEYKPDVHLVYWQLCPDGHVSGIVPEVDINVFNGFRKDFEEY